MMLMFTSIIAAAAFAGILAGFAVQKIFYSVIGTACYVYLFLTVGGSFDLQFGFVSAHPVGHGDPARRGGVLLVLVARMLRERIEKWWEEAKEGGQHPRPPACLLRARRAPGGDQLGGDARHHRRVPRGLQHPRQLPHADARRGRETRSRT